MDHVRPQPGMAPYRACSIEGVDLIRYGAGSEEGDPLNVWGGPGIRSRRKTGNCGNWRPRPTAPSHFSQTPHTIPDCNASRTERSGSFRLRGSLVVGPGSLIDWRTVWELSANNGAGGSAKNDAKTHSLVGRRVR